MDDQQLKDAFAATPTDALRHELHQRGYWVAKNGQIVTPAEMYDGWLVNTLRYQFKIAEALQMMEIANIGRMFISRPPEPGLILRGEYALMTIDNELLEEDEEWRWSDLDAIHIPTLEDLLRSQPIVPHLYAEVKRRKLLDLLNREQRAMLYLISGEEKP